MKKKKNMKVILRPLEREDLSFIHNLNNERQTMAFWFEEPYESLDELVKLYDKHIHEDNERRFVIDVDGKFAGVIELIEINFIHRTTEIQIIIKQDFRGLGLSKTAILLGLDYAFNILNLHKVYAYVDIRNTLSLNICKDIGFIQEGVLRQHFFAEGMYRDSIFIGILKNEVQLSSKEIKGQS